MPDDARATVRTYLQHCNGTPSGITRRRDQLYRRVERLTRQIATTGDPLRQVELRQQRIECTDALKALPAPEDAGTLEAAFIRLLPDYSAQRHISYRAWREVGVPARVLRAAGLQH